MSNYPNCNPPINNPDDDLITDGFGNYYKATCPNFGAPMQTVKRKKDWITRFWMIQMLEADDESL